MGSCGMETCQYRDESLRRDPLSRLRKDSDGLFGFISLFDMRGNFMSGQESVAQRPERGSALRLSRGLKTVHFAALAVLVVVVGAVTVWMSQEYTRLARGSGKALVAASITTFEQRVTTLLSDYSNWDEAYEAAKIDDREWLYNNLGTGATETQWADMVIVTGDNPRSHFGWTADGGTEAQTNLLQAELVQQLLDLIVDNPPDRSNIATSFTWIDDQLWILAINQFLPYDTSVFSAGETIPKNYQIHALKMDASVLNELEAQTLLPGFSLRRAEVQSPYWVPLLDANGQIVAKLAWDLPNPGLGMLGSIGIPLIASIGIVILVAIVFSRLAVRSAERLELMLEHALAADKAKSEFLANVGHELRTPMNAVIGLSSLLKGSELQDSDREVVNVLNDAAESHMELLNKLLDFGQLGSGNWVLQFREFNVTKVVEDVAATFKTTAEQKGVTLSVTSDMMPSQPQVLGDAVAVRQIVSNLLQNAIKFTDQGSVTVQIKAVSMLDEMEVSISVTDTGSGIPKEDQHRIFERFARANRDAAIGVPGTGLGLSICSSLASLMGGSLHMQSEFGVGSSFTFRTRFEKAPTEAVEPATISTTPAAHAMPLRRTHS